MNINDDEYTFIFMADRPGPIVSAPCFGGPLDGRCIETMRTVKRFCCHPAAHERSIAGLGVVTSVYDVRKMLSGKIVFKYDKDEIIYRSVDAFRRDDGAIITPDQICHCDECRKYRSRLFTLAATILN